MQNDNFKENFSKLRADSNLTQKEVADRLFCSDKVVSKWECGQVMPDVETLVNIANLFDTDVDALLSNHLERRSKSDGGENIILKRRLKYNAISLIIDIFCLFLLISMAIMVARTYKSMPEQIAVHFNAMGEIDGYGSKNMIFISFAISFIAYLLISLLNILKIRWCINIGLPVYIDTFVQDPKHRNKLYVLMSIGVNLIKLCFVQLFCIINFFMVKQIPLNIGVFYSSLAMLIIMPIIVMIVGVILVANWRKIEKENVNIGGLK